MRRMIKAIAILLIVVGSIGTIFTYLIGGVLGERESYEKTWAFDELDRLVIESDDHLTITFIESPTNFIEIKGMLLEDVVAKLEQTEFLNGELTLDLRFRQPLNIGFIDISRAVEQQVVVALDDATLIRQLEAKTSSSRLTVIDGLVEEGYLQASSGRIDIQGYQGKMLQVRTSSGSIRGQEIRIEEKFSAKASSGGISLTQLQASEILLSTSSGSIRLEDASGNLVAQASSGSINLEEVIGDVSIKASSGSVRLSQPQVSTTEVTTSSGAVRISIPRGFTGHFDVRSSSGSINIPQAKRESSEYVKVQTSSGSIRIEER